MSRSSYTDDCSNWDIIKWRGMVASAIRGKRGQAFLQRLGFLMDKMPIKGLIKEAVVDDEGCCCALGVVGIKTIPLEQFWREMDPMEDPEWSAEMMGRIFNISEVLVREIQYINDDRGPHDESPAQRWERVRNWVEENIKKKEVSQ